MSEIRLRIYVLMLSIIAIGVIWVVGSGNAAQSALEDVVYSKGTYAQAGQTQQQGGDDMSEPKHSIAYYTKLMADIAYKIHTRYMEDVDPESLVESGIEGMLANLDPYSVILKPKTYNALMENTHGKYEGVGMQIDLRDNRVTIVAPMEGTPAWRMGFRAGDQIMKIDSTSTDGMSTEEASNLMRGPAGTKVDLSIKRPGVEGLLDFDVERAVIELKSVKYYGMVQPGVGYVRIDKFAEQTTDELRDAVLDMKNNMGMKSLIFDLRSNGGGLLDQAISVANLFLPKDKLVVYTKGKYPTSEKRYFSSTDPIFPDGDMVVLVNGGTASASEIVSGSLQDWDRAVILGSTTFGKGLVQQIFGGDQGDFALKLTTAKYYIPSGRCIQKPEKAHKNQMMDMSDDIGINANPDEVDTSRQVYYTNDGRPVYGGGGVVPDVKVAEEMWKPIEYNLIRQNLFFDFAVDYTTAHPDIKEDFEVTQPMMNDFRDYIKKQKFTYKTGLELDLDKFADAVKDDNKTGVFDKDISDIRASIDKEKSKDFDASSDYIRQSIKREILRAKFGESAVYKELTLKEDKDVLKALDILQNKAKYSDLLKPAKKEKADKG